MKFLSQWLEKIELLDEVSAAKAKLALIVALLLITMMAFVYPVLFNISPENLMMNYVFIGSSTFCVLSSVFLSIRNPGNVFSGYLVLAAIFINIANACLYYGGIRTPGTHLFVVIPIIASTLFNRRAALITFFVNILLIGLFFILWKMDKLPAIPQSFIEKENIIKLIVVFSVMCLSFLVSYSSQKITLSVISELKQIYDTHPNGIVKINAKGKVLYSNTSFKKIFKFSIDNINEFFTNEFNSEISLENLVKSHSPIQVTSSSGRAFLVNFLPGSRLSWEKGLIFFLDDTLVLEKSNLEKILAEKNAKASMIATYNHEINNPLTIAMAYAKKLDTTHVDPASYLKLSNALIRIKDVIKKIDQINH